MINYDLAKGKGFSERRINWIQEAQDRRNDCHRIINMYVKDEFPKLSSDREESREEAKKWMIDLQLEILEDIEFKLQILWGFPEDRNYHRFWDIQSCTCPKIDNEDNYPEGPYTYSGGCPVHKWRVRDE